jgi:membrane protein DedA with SNARE-associated domain
MTRLRVGLQQAPVWLYLPLTLIWATATMMVGYTMSNVMLGDPAFSGFPTFAWIGVLLAAVVAAIGTWWRYGRG